MAPSLLPRHGMESSDSPGARYEAGMLPKSAQTLAEQAHNTQHDPVLSLTLLTLIGMTPTLVKKQLCDGLKKNGCQH